MTHPRRGRINGPLGDPLRLGTHHKHSGAGAQGQMTKVHDPHDVLQRDPGGALADQLKESLPGRPVQAFAVTGLVTQYVLQQQARLTEGVANPGLAQDKSRVIERRLGRRLLGYLHWIPSAVPGDTYAG